MFFCILILFCKNAKNNVFYTLCFFELVELEISGYPVDRGLFVFSRSNLISCTSQKKGGATT